MDKPQFENKNVYKKSTEFGDIVQRNVGTVSLNGETKDYDSVTINQNGKKTKVTTSIFKLLQEAFSIQ